MNKRNGIALGDEVETFPIVFGQNQIWKERKKKKINPLDIEYECYLNLILNRCMPFITCLIFQDTPRISTFSNHLESSEFQLIFGKNKKYTGEALK